MDFTLTQLQTIITIFECGSVTRAAEVLKRPQPSVSRTLKEVEDQIGAQIFDRSTRSFKLTQHGEVLIRHARSVLAEMQHARNELTALDQRLANQVRVGVHAIAAASIMIPAMTRFRACIPDAYLEVDEDRTQRLLQLLKHGEYDFLVVTVPNEPVENVVFEVLFESKLGIFVRAQHPLAKVGEPTFEELVAYPWIYPGTPSHRARVMDNEFSVNGVKKPDMGFATMSPELTRHALLNNDWVVLTQVDLLLDERQHGRVVELKTPDLLRDVPVAIAERAAAQRSEVAEMLIGYIRSEAKIHQGDDEN